VKGDAEVIKRARANAEAAGINIKPLNQSAWTEAERTKSLRAALGVNEFTATALAVLSHMNDENDKEQATMTTNTSCGDVDDQMAT
ncbi:hypothetical protein, partial [Erwinia amylovora]|uniref:hypothetical protein n=1 Tax=Erwinia amylovora TaxID=552 RepID=UPI0020BE8E4D